MAEKDKESALNSSTSPERADSGATASVTAQTTATHGGEAIKKSDNASQDSLASKASEAQIASEKENANNPILPEKANSLLKEDSVSTNTSSESTVNRDKLFETEYLSSEDLNGKKKLLYLVSFPDDPISHAHMPGMAEKFPGIDQIAEENNQDESLQPYYQVTATTSNVLPFAQSIVSTIQEDNIAVINILSTNNINLAGFTFLELPQDGTLYLDAGRTKLATIGITYDVSSIANNGDITVYYVPHANWSGTVNFEYTVTDAKGNISPTATIDLTVIPIADAPDLALIDQSVGSNVVVPLTILTNATDNSEFISSITLSGIPQEATLHNDADVIAVINGSVTLSIDDLVGLAVTPALNYYGNFDIKVTATSQESSDSSQTAQTEGWIHITIADTVPPTNTAAIDDISNDTGLSDSDFITSATTFTVTGTLHNALASDEILELSTDGGFNWIQIDNRYITGTTWSYPLSSALEDNIYSFVMRVSDTQDNHGSSSIPLTVLIDSTNPEQPLLFEGISNDTGISSSDNITSATTFNVNGSLGSALEAGETLQIRVIDPDGNAHEWVSIAPQDITPKGDGTFSFNQPFKNLINNGQYTFQAQVIDLAGNTTESIATQQATVDTIAPTQHLSIDTMINDLGVSTFDFQTSARTFEIQGSISSALKPGEMLKIQIDDGQPQTVPPNAINGVTNGQYLFRYNFSNLSQGPHVIGIYLEDAAGNIGQHSAAREIILDYTKPVTDGVDVNGLKNDITVPITLTANDANGIVNFTINTLPTHGTLYFINGFTQLAVTAGHSYSAINSASYFSFVPQANWMGDTSFTYTATDTAGNISDSNTANIHIYSVIDTTLATFSTGGDEDTAIGVNINFNNQLDPTETVSAVTITGFPSGTTFNLGTLTNGVLTISNPGLLSTIFMTPPTNYSGTINLTVVGTVQDGTVTNYLSSHVTVDVTPIADPGAASGYIDISKQTQILAIDSIGNKTVPLTIFSAVTDTDGSESVQSIKISNIPNGFNFTNFYNQTLTVTNGVLTLTPLQLLGLKVTFPDNYNSKIDFKITVDTVESANNDTEVSPRSSFTVYNSYENTQVNIQFFTTQEADQAGVKYIAFNSLNPAAGALYFNLAGNLTPVVYQGTYSADAQFVFSPASGYTGAIYFPYVTLDSTYKLIAQNSLNLIVNPIAEAPTVDVSAAMGTQTTVTISDVYDKAIALNITPKLADTDGSESINAIKISNIPQGAIFTNAANETLTVTNDHTLTLTSAQLTGLSVKLPAYTTGNFNLAVTASSQEQGDTIHTATSASSIITLNITNPVPTLPIKNAGYYVNEDTTINNIQLLTSQESSSNNIANIKFTDLPTVKEGELFVQSGSSFVSVSKNTLYSPTAIFKFIPAENYSGFIDVKYVAVDQYGNQSTNSNMISVTLVPVSDSTVVDVDAASGNQTTVSVSANPGYAVPLFISPQLTDTDGSEAFQTILISNIPTGATFTNSINSVLTVFSGTLAINNMSQLDGLKMMLPNNLLTGTYALNVTALSKETSLVGMATPTNLPGSTINIVVAPGISQTTNEDTATSNFQFFQSNPSGGASIRFTDLPTYTEGALSIQQGASFVEVRANTLYSPTSVFKFTPYSNYSGNIDIKYTVLDSQGSPVVNSSYTSNIYVTPIADIPSLSLGYVAGSANAGTSAVYNVPVLLNINPSSNDSDGSEKISSITISNIPNNVSFTNSAGDTLTVVGGNLVLTDVKQLQGLSATIVNTNLTTTIILTVTATSQEVANISSSATSANSYYTITVSNSGASAQASYYSTNEDQVINNLQIFKSYESFNGTIKFSDLPTAQQGTLVLQKGSSYVAVDTNTFYQPTDIFNFIPGANYSNYSNYGASFRINFNMYDSGGNFTSSSYTSISVVGAPDKAIVDVSSTAGTQTSVGISATDQPLVKTSLYISPQSSDTDGSETHTITISNIPTGALLTNTLNGALTVSNGTITLTAGQLTGLQIAFLPNTSGTFYLNVTANTQDSGNSSATATSNPSTIILTVTDTTVPMPTGLTLSVYNGTFALNTSSYVNSSGLTVTGQSDVMIGDKIQVQSNSGAWIDVTAPATSVGMANYSYRYSGLSDGAYQFKVRVVDSSGNASTPVISPIITTVDNTSPTLTTLTSSGSEDATVVTVALTGSDTNGITNFWLTSLPANGTLYTNSSMQTIAQTNFPYTPTSANTLTLYFHPNANWGGNTNFQYMIVDRANNSATGTATINIAPVADAPLLDLNSQTVGNQLTGSVSGNDNTFISLPISASLTDTDGSESIKSIVVSNIPSGAIFSNTAGNNLVVSGGTLTLTSLNQLTGLAIKLPSDFNGSFNLSVTATSQENSNTSLTASTTGTINVTVADHTAPTPAILTVNVDAGEGVLSNGAILNTSSLTVSGNASLLIGEKVQININSGGWNDLTSAATNVGTLAYNQTYSGLTSGSYQYQVRVIDASGNFSTSVNSNTVIVDSTAPDTNAASASVNENYNGSILLSGSDTNGVRSFSLQSLPSNLTLYLDSSHTQPVSINTSYTAINSQLTLYYVSTAYWNGSENFTYKATDVAGNMDLTPATATITVNPIVDTTMSVSNVTTLEDTTVALPISFNQHGDLKETVQSITISGFEVGTTFTNSNGDVLTPVGNILSLSSAAQAIGLSMTPPTNYSGSHTVTVTSMVLDNGVSKTLSDTMTLTVNADVDTTFSASSIGGVEDTPIPLIITTDNNGDSDEVVSSITITGFPMGANFSAGVLSEDGSSLALTSDQLSDLTMTPPTDFSGMVDLQIAVSVTDNGVDKTITQNLSVGVQADVDTTFTASSAGGNEDTAIPLTIATTNHGDSDEVVNSVTITGFEAGTSFSAGVLSNGTLTLTPNQLTNLTMTPAANFSGTVELQIAVNVTENGVSKTLTQNLPVAVTSIADAPTLDINFLQEGDQDTVTIAANDNTSIPLNIAVNALDSSESITAITLAGVPAFGVLKQGNTVLVPEVNGIYNLDPSDLSNLTVTFPANINASFNFVVTATSQSNDNPSSTTTKDATIILNISDTTAPTPETLTVALDAGRGVLSNGATIAATSLTVSGQASLGVGDYIQININEGGWNNLTDPASTAGTIDYNHTYTNLRGGNYQYQVRVMDAGGNFSAPISSDTVTLDTTAPDADDVTSTISEDSSDGSIILTASNSSDVAQFTLTSLPSNVMLYLDSEHTQAVSVGTPYDATNGELTLYYLPTTSWSGVTSFRYTAADALSNIDQTPATATISVTPIVVFSLDLDTQALGSDLSVTINGFDNKPIPLNISLISPDTDGSEVLSLIIRNIPQGVTLKNSDSQTFTYSSNNATYNSSTEQYDLTLTPNQLEGLRIIFPPNTDKQILLPVIATAVDGSESASVNGMLNFYIQDLTAPILPQQLTTLHTNEDKALADFGFFTAVEATASDIEGIIFTDIPKSGVEGTLQVKQGTTYVTVATNAIYSPTSVFKFTPTANYSGDIDMKFVAIDAAGNTSATTVIIDISPVADVATVDVNLATAGVQTSITRQGNPGSFVPLNIIPNLTDTDGSENVLLVSIEGIPAGTTFTNNLGETFNYTGSSRTFTLDQLDGLRIKLSSTAAVGSTVSLGVRVTTQETEASETAVSSYSTMNINVVQGKTVFFNEQTPGANFQFFTTAPTNMAVIKFTELPASGTLAFFNGTSYTNITSTTASYSATGFFRFTPAPDYSGAVYVTYQGYRTGGTTPVGTPYKGNFFITGLADQPSQVDVSSADDLQTTTTITGNDGQFISLYMGSTPTDTDGSESIKSYTLSNIPAGAILTNSNGVVLTAVDGVLTVTPAQIPDQTVLIKLPLGTQAGQYSLSVVATSQELGNLVSTATSQTSTYILNINPTAGTAIPTLSPITINEDDPYVTFQPMTQAQVSNMGIARVTFMELPDSSIGILKVINDSGQSLPVPLPVQLGVTYSATSYFLFFPAKNYSGVVDLSYYGMSAAGYRNPTAVNLKINVTSVPDAPTVDVDTTTPGTQIITTINTDGYASVALNIAPILSDLDGSEFPYQIVISNIPAGATFTNMWNDTFTVTNNTLTIDHIGSLQGLTMTLPNTIPDGTYSLKVAASSIDFMSGTPNYVYGDPGDKSTISVVVDRSGDSNYQGTSGAETLFGGAGKDTIDAKGGDDIIIGGKGDDTLTGGTGVDRFVWQSGDDGTVQIPAIDHIKDFTVGNPGDVLDLKGLFQADTTAEILQHLSFTVSNGNTTININPTGKGVTQKIVLDNVDLSQGGTITDDQIINSLVSNNQLITD